MVPRKGLEPLHLWGQRILSPPCLPFHHLGINLICHLHYAVMFSLRALHSLCSGVWLQWVACNASSHFRTSTIPPPGHKFDLSFALRSYVFSPCTPLALLGIMASMSHLQCKLAFSHIKSSLADFVIIHKKFINQYFFKKL